MLWVHDLETSKSRSILSDRKLSDVFERKLKNDSAAQHEVATSRQDHGSLAYTERLFHVHADLSDFAVLIHCHGGHLANLSIPSADCTAPPINSAASVSSSIGGCAEAGVASSKNTMAIDF